MEGFQFIDIIILAMVAGFIVLRLRSVLGRRTGNEPSPRDRINGALGRPTDPATDRGTDNRAPDNVVTLPGARRRDTIDIEPAYQGTPLEQGLVQLKMADPRFAVAPFLEGAAKAFEMVVAAFAKHDADTLKPLTSPEVYSRFAAAIQDREDRGETMETELVVLKPPRLESVDMQGTRAVVAVRFQSEQVNLVKDRTGAVIEGDREHIESVTDVWTFSRDISDRNPNWVLIATRSVE